ncbi:N-hydroxyarylamine O-acetyltransferase [Acetitomaculum ruminis DSM 5522]|uniref:N-hydroxyarylamine O-acetyltransferase n=1 Tax=Acetitomaculum ruminis DSM 5522 TaxID=1120918 RepID=A0A1I0W6A5_9FIRM|nr:arylamine N-acetyltransferase [Acetitomaculum ruminis]SFA84064.1 N-hydroxyarylamine O-acetyltransferase [Acetitomaculum ruminis DSM 5522]
MLEELFAKIEDPKPYLERIGIDPKRIIKPDKETLDELIYAHQCSVPFENLNSWKFKQPVSLYTDALLEKILGEGRGGYCFELNGIFNKLLQSLGYVSFCVYVRVGYNPTDPRPVSHRGIFVNIDEEFYYVDVGFGGPMPAGAVHLVENERQEFKGEYFWFEKLNQVEWILWRENNEGKFEANLVVSTIARDELDFLSLNLVMSTGKDSLFTKVPYISIRTKEGHNSIKEGNKLIIEKNSVIEEKILENDDELFDALEKYFGIKKILRKKYL